MKKKWGFFRFFLKCFKLKSLLQVWYPKYNTIFVLSLTWAGFWSLVPTPDHAWSEINDTAATFSGEALCCAVTVLWSVAWVGCIHTKGDHRGAQRGRQMKWSTWQSAALVHKPQQCPSAGLTNPGCSWPQGTKDSSTLSVSHKKLPHKRVPALSAPLLCTHSGAIFRTVSMLAVDHTSQAGDRQWYSWVY